MAVGFNADLAGNNLNILWQNNILSLFVIFYYSCQVYFKKGIYKNTSMFVLVMILKFDYCHIFEYFFANLYLSTEQYQLIFTLTKQQFLSDYLSLYSFNVSRMISTKTPQYTCLSLSWYWNSMIVTFLTHFLCNVVVLAVNSFIIYDKRTFYLRLIIFLLFQGLFQEWYLLKHINVWIYHDTEIQWFNVTFLKHFLQCCCSCCQ